MECEFCGDSCTLCSQQYGCVQDFKVGQGLRFVGSEQYPASRSLYSALAPSSTFATSQSCKDERCSNCGTLNSSTVLASSYLQCDACFQYVNIYFEAKLALLTCFLCNSSIPNCLQCDSDKPGTCLSCKSGYYIDKIANTCNFCGTTGCNRCSQNGCLECLDGYVLSTSGTCVKCDLSVFNEGYFAHDVRCTQCKATDKTQCQYCNYGFMNSLHSPNTCELTCDDNQFPNAIYTNMNYNNILTATTCDSCDKSCLTCAGPLSSNCLSCPASSYLLIGSIPAQTGSCKTRIQVPQQTLIEIYVTNVIPANPQTVLLSADIGSFTNPAFDFLFALQIAKDQASKYASGSSVPVTIYLTSGSHYVIRDRADTSLQFQHTSLKGVDNLNYALTISPIPCSKNLANVQSACTDGQVTIYNKQRELFEIEVPANLTLNRVIIDSLDSILYDTLEPCLDLRQNCCQITNNVVTTIPNAAKAGVCEQAIQTFQSSFESSCTVNQARTMFKMQLNTNGDVLKPNNLTITGSEIRNIYYAMNSLISLTKIQGVLLIKDSKFLRLSICGGIVKNTFAEPTIPQVQTHTNLATLTNLQVKSIILRQSLESSATPQSPNYVPKGMTCSANECFSITIATSSFTEIPSQLASTSNLKLVSKSNGLQFQGMVLNLDGFSGPVSITGSTFQNNKLPLNTCSVAAPSTTSSLNNFSQLSNPLTSFDKVQLTSLISIQNSVKSIQIANNTFTGNLMTSGLIRIGASGITNITGNAFIQNAAAIQTNLMTVRQCTGLSLKQNTFNNNIGCQDTGGIKIQCLSATGFNYLAQTDQYSINDGAVPTSPSAVNLESNVYRGNFIGNKNQFLSIEGFKTVTMTSDFFTYNENFLPQAFIKYSPMQAQLSNQNEFKSLDTLGGYKVRAQAVLRIASSVQVMLATVSFDSNWILDDYSQYTEYQSILLIQDLVGSLSVANTSWLNHKGSGNSIVANIISSGIQSSLLFLKDVKISSLVFSKVTFGANQGTSGPLDLGQVKPLLFRLDQSQFDSTVSQVTLSQLTLRSNMWTNADSIVIFKLNNLVIDAPSIIVNQVDGSVIRLEYLSSTSVVTFSSGIITSNTAGSGSIIYATEALEGNFIQLFIFSTNKYLNLNILNTQFSLNTGSATSSCVTVVQSLSSYSFSWMTLMFQNVEFSENSGALTNELYFANSMVMNVVIDGAVWNIPITDLVPSKLAQVIYKNDVSGYLTISNSVFSCSGQSYSNDVVMKFNKANASGRAGLFRISDSSGLQVQPMLNPYPNLQFSQTNGTLNATYFRNQFNTNQYKNCNNVRRGAIYYLENGARVSETNSSYTDNSALEGGIAYLKGDGTYLSISSLQYPYIQKTFAYYGALVFATDGATAQISFVTQIRSNAAFEGVIAYLQNRARLILKDQITVKSNNISKRGLINALEGSQFWVQGVVFSGNTAAYDSAVIFAQGCRELYSLVNGDTPAQYGKSNILISYLINVSIDHPSTTNGRLITLIDSHLALNNVTFTYIDSIYDVNTGIYVFDGDLEVTLSNFQGPILASWFTQIYQKKLKNINGAFISLFGQSTLNLASSSLTGGRGTLGGCVAILGASNSKITNTTFTQCAAMQGGAIYAIGFVSLNVMTSTFENNLAYQGYGQNIYAEGATSSLSIKSSNFTSYHNSLYFRGQSLSVKQSTFKSDNQTNSQVAGLNARSYGAGLYIADTFQVDVSNTQFINLVGIKGGAVFISETPNSHLSLDLFLGKTSSYSVSFKEITVANCNATEDGGGFYIENTQNAVISTLATISGSAKGNGGGVAFYCTPDPNLVCGLKLQNVLFDSCKSAVGGAIFWNFIEPSMEAKKDREQLQFGAKNKTTYGSLAFTNCDASVYGRQISGVPQELIEINDQQFIQYFYRQDKDKASTPLKLETLKFFFRKTYDGVSSGSLVPDSYYAVIDKYGQVVSNSLGGNLHYSMLAQPLGPASEFSTEITGVKDFFSMYGVFNTTGMGILSEPGITIPGVLTFNGIDTSIPTVKAFLSSKYQTKIQANWQYNITINMLVRGCVVGEGLKVDGACFVCPKGTYLLEIPVTATECQVCSVEKSICLGGADIGPQRGYWRKSEKSYNFISCYYENSCLGLQENLTKPPNHPTLEQKLGLCNTTFGYYGALCSGCLPGFKRVGNFQCSACGQYEIYFQIGGLVGAMAALCYLVHSTIKGSIEDNTSSIYIKIMLNHMQMLLITSSFDLAWPADVKAIFNFAAPIKEFMNSIISFDCWMDQRNIQDVDVYNFYAPGDEWRVTFQKLIISAGLPVVIAVGSHSSWWVILKIQKKSSELFTKFTATVVLLLFLVHPSITQSMIDMFNCADYDGDLRLVVDLQVICYTGLHKYLAFGLALPCLIVWGIGIPITVFMMMRKDSGMLETNAVKQKFGFLYNGYKRQNYFWEIVIMYRKIFCIFIAVFLKRIGIIVQALVLLIVLMMFMQANSSRRPFAARALNDIESMSLITQIVTIYCGLFFVSSKDRKSESFNVNTDFYLDDTGKFAFFLVIAVCNVGFVLLWLTKYIQVIRVLIKDKYPRLYVYLFLCGRFDKMVQETAKRAKDSKKEAIIECIESIVLNMQKMKGLYADSIFYEDHNRFLKLLYYIEAERLQIDLTEKKHNYYIQGNIQRLRKFDPAIIKERQNLRELNVVTNVDRDNMVINQQKKTIQDSLGMTTSMFLQGIAKLKEKAVVQQPQSRNQDSAKRINVVQPQSVDEENKIGMQTGRSEGLSVVRGQVYNVNDETDLLELDDDDGFTQMNQSQKKSQKQKQRKKPNVADLTTFFTKTRQNRFSIHAEKKTRIRVADIGEDGKIVDKSALPEFLVGFRNVYAVPESQNSQDENSQDSIHSRLHMIRKLTEREYSPEKTISFTKKDREDHEEGLTQIDTVQNPSEITGTTHEVPLKVYKNVTGGSEELKEQDNEFKIDGAREIVVTKGGGQEKPKNQVAVLEEEPIKRMRPKKGARVEYREDGMVVEHLAQSTIDPDLEELNGQLQITILDDDEDLINRTKRAREKTIDKSKSLKEYEVSVEEDIAAFEQQDSFKTDSSMREYDLQDMELRPQTADLFEKAKSSKRSEAIGDGLGVKKRGGQAPVIILNTSESAAGDSAFGDSARQLDGKDFYQERKSRNN